MTCRVNFVCLVLVAVVAASARPVQAQTWQVDFQGNDNHNGLFGQSGPTDAAGPGTWNIFEVQSINDTTATGNGDGDPSTVSDVTPSAINLPLVDSTGAAGSVSLEVVSEGGFLSGWGGSGGDAVTDDYLLALSPGGDSFFGYPGASNPLNFSIDGLDSNTDYDLTFIHGTVSSNRGLEILANGIATSISTATVESTIRVASNGTGNIAGTATFFGDEGDWAGLVVTTIPEPASAALLVMGATACLFMRRR